MKFDFCKYTDVGGRANNEDSIGVYKNGEGYVCIVADGLGGHENGEIASGIAVRTLSEKVKGVLSEEMLRAAADEANSRVLDAAAGNGMKTTLTALWFAGDRALSINVGDSRTYQFRNRQIYWRTTDHSLAQLDILAGDDTYQDVRQNPDRNKLVRVVGMSNGFKSDIEEIACRKGDAFLLCSDGFWENLTDQEMLEALQSSHNAMEWLTSMWQILRTRLNEDSDNNSAIAVMLT